MLWFIYILKMIFFSNCIHSDMAFPYSSYCNTFLPPEMFKKFLCEISVLIAQWVFFVCVIVVVVFFSQETRQTMNQVEVQNL